MLTRSYPVTEVDSGRPLPPKMGDINQHQRQHHRQQQQQPPARDYSVETDRLLTFARWPADAPVAGGELARAGFYYTGAGLEAVCSACGTRRGHWSPAGTERLADIHSADCRFRHPPTAAATTPAPHREQQREERSGGLAGEVLMRGGPISFQSDAAALERHRLRGVPTFEKVWPQLSGLYTCESERAKTFSDWPLSFVSGADLAAAGFVYLRESDHVQCVFCHGEVMDWEEGDVPADEHRRHFPRCPMVLGTAANLAIGSRPPVQTVYGPPVTRPGFDECGSSSTAQPPTPPSSHNGSSATPPVLHTVVNQHQASPLHRTAQQLSDLNVVPHGVPQYPKFATRDARLKSYHSWPANGAQSVNSLVEAGLFYVGHSDQVKCFQCGGGLQNWEAKDVAWEEHARWFPACNFVVLNKGRDYVEKSKQHRPPVLPSPNAGENSSSGFASDRPLARRPLPDDELDVLMNEDMVKSVLELGFDGVVVREVLRRRMEQAGYQFTNADLLATAVLEHGDNLPTTPKPEVASPDPSGAESERPLQTSVNMENVQATTTHVANAESESAARTSEQELKLCKVCMDQEMNVVFLPCGHFMACTDCASAMSDCPLCRVPIKGTVKTYWP